MTKRFLPRWVLATTTGETLGFAVPAATGTVMAMVAAPPGVVYVAMIIAGAVEGALLGLGQWWGFGPTRPVPGRAWVGATAAGAALAWSIGMLPSTLGGLDPGSPRVIVAAALGGLVLLASIPVLQWLVLRRVLRPSWWWIPVNMGAWSVGLLWTLAPSPLVDERTPTAVLFGVYLLAGALMAATVAVLTGLAAGRITHTLTHDHAHSPAAPIS
ncbi:hypothetical protein GCM10009767_07240 [Kocuria aegyptia]|uniref:Uncharacterized protein n=2 Tax=Kocuria aegyptia TaxID=330943 RepID=A0ABN2K9I9_9MICC